MPDGRVFRLLLPPLVAVLTVIVGCSQEDRPPTYPVSGTIAFADGKPLVGARIQFLAEGKSPTILARGKTDDEGRFTLTTFEDGDGAVEGKHLVAVSPFVPDDFDGMTDAERRRAMFPIDPRFKDYRSSGLTATVTTDPTQNEFSFEVRPPRRR